MSVDGVRWFGRHPRVLKWPLVVATAACLATCAAESPRAAARSNKGVCPGTVASLVTALNSLDSRLDIGLTFDSYGNLLGDANVAYGRIVVRTLSHTCITQVGEPAEKALNFYVAAYNSWSTCLDWYDSPDVQESMQWNNYVAPSCETGPGHGFSFRQRQWSNAHGNVRRAIDALG